MKYAVFILPVFLFFSQAWANAFTGQVVSVLDGDTIEVLHNGQAERIRLNGIDCPEKRQPFGKKAKQFTSSLVFGKEVTVQPLRKDRHGRTVGNVILSDGTNVSRELVKAGLAWWYRQYSKDDALAALELEAHEAKRGLWSDPNPIPPWELRHPSKKPHSPSRTEMSPPSDTLTPNQPIEAHKTATVIIGNRKSDIYHRPDCPSYTMTKPQNRVTFETVEAAEAAGYRLARNCP